MNMHVIKEETYRKHLTKIHQASMDTKSYSCEYAVKHVRKQILCDTGIDQDDGRPLDVAVSYDGSWQKRGFTSKNGIGSVVEIESGLVLDYETKSKYCQQCVCAAYELKKDSPVYKDWYTEHVLNKECDMNWSQSSSAMESGIALELWGR